MISTWVPSFSPEYKDILEVSDDTPEGFVRKIDEVLSWDEVTKLRKFNQIKEWFEVNKNWDRQAARLMEFVRAKVL